MVGKRNLVEQAPAHALMQKMTQDPMKLVSGLTFTTTMQQWVVWFWNAPRMMKDLKVMGYQNGHASLDIYQSQVDPVHKWHDWFNENNIGVHGIKFCRVAIVPKASFLQPYSNGLLNKFSNGKKPLLQLTAEIL